MTIDLDTLIGAKPTSALTPTAEQQDIIQVALETRDNILINALAGAAKTTTLELICRALPVQPILSLAFNKRIATEMTKRLPGHVACHTLNAIGHRVWMQSIPKRLVVDTKKSYNILKGIVDALPRAEKSEVYESFSDILKLVGTAKLAGYIPSGISSGKPLVEGEAFWETIDEDLADIAKGLVDRVLKESITQSYSGLIDFDDQIYMPTLFGGTFPRYGLVLVDEAQDLSSLNHAMLEKLVTGRLIAVGDPYQSIYAFRGAMTTSMATLQQRFNMRPMGLSISFRCPRAIVERARFRAPHMLYPEWAKEGWVDDQTMGRDNRILWSADLIPDGAAVICRNNAPLFRLAFALIRAGRGVSIVGSDVGPGLVKALKKLGPETGWDGRAGGPDLNEEQAYAAIDRWEKEKLQKAKGKATVKDKAECLRVFVSVGRSLAGAIAYAESIFRSQGPIQLLSGHKSKGLEWDHVFHLDPGRIPSPYCVTDEEIDQEYNVRYVIETRAKESLTLVNMEDYREGI
jgi:superfamily I DNA/RNA helicase